jgi:hypothetical protein
MQHQAVVLRCDFQILQAFSTGKRNSVPELIFKMGRQGVCDSLNARRRLANDVWTAAGDVLGVKGDDLR